jgi:membrane fusion protein, type I secretion system
MQDDPASAYKSIQQHRLFGLGLVVFLTFGIGGWAATTDIAGALIAPGSLVVGSHVKLVQHPTGGIVAELRVHDGDLVKEGDILARLDDTATRANLAIYTKGLDELTARKARLKAERDGRDSITFPPTLLARAKDPDVDDILVSERRLFDLRRTARLGEKAQLKQRIEQLQDEIGGQESQLAAKGEQITLIQRELAGVQALYAKKLVPITRLTQLQREKSRLDGERGQLIATTAQSKGKIAEIRLQIIQIDQNLSSEVGKELREIDAKVGEFVERKIAAEDQLKRIDIRAPQAGTVFQSTVHTIGGVIKAGDPIMTIVPEADKLEVEAKINPHNINEVQVGQTATLRFSSFNIRTTPEINGKVAQISADTSTDQRTGQSYYSVRISLPPQDLAKLGNVKLLPGMPVEAFVQTGERTVISYLMKPIRDQIARAFTEK